MARHTRSREGLGPYRVQTVNASSNAANRIHEDATATAYGFRGGLVDGTRVYAHLTTPLVECLGTSWLDGSVSELQLLQPAYDADVLTVTGTPRADADGAWGFLVQASNEAGEVVATLDTRLPSTPPPVDARATRRPAPPSTPRQPISWDALELDAPLRALRWCPSAEAQATWCAHARDALSVYRTGPAPRVHPGLVLQAANDVFAQHFQLEPWLHTGSRVLHRSAVRLGEGLEIRAVPIEKWTRSGHQFVRLYVCMVRDGLPMVEVYHTAIFRIREAQARA